MCIGKVLQLTSSLLTVSAAVWLCADANEMNTDTELRPYLLVATHNKILRMSLNGTNVTTLITDSGIMAMDYHYRLNLLFWVTNFYPDVKYASLSDGSNVKALHSRHIRNSAGLAVDWINDKVYWTDRTLNAIYVYDLNTKETSKIRDLPESNPTKLKIFPQSNDSSWLYMGDRKREGIYRVPMDGDKDDEKIIDTQCPDSLALDYKSRYLYWIDGCNYQLGTSKVDGTLDHLLRTGANRFFPYGCSVLKSHIYWTQAGEVSFVYCFETKSAVEDEIYSQKNTIMRDIQIVHPSNQPSLLELGELDSCLQSCGHGNCILSPGECTCDEGWTGPSCLTDINECQEGNGGCQQQCVNTPGSFHCECEQGPNGRTCTTLAPPTSSAPPSTPLKTTSSSPTTPPKTTPTTSAPPTTPPTTTSTPPTPTTPPPTPPSPQTMATTAVPTTLTPTSNSNPNQRSTSSTTDEITPDIDDIGVTELNTEDGLKVQESSSTPMILVIVFSAIVVIVIVAASMYTAFLFFKCKQRRKGSYDVHTRHQNKQTELGTSSAHSSFRDITVQYQREERALAELGYIEGLGQSADPCEPEPGYDGLRWPRTEASSSCGLIEIETVPEIHT